MIELIKQFGGSLSTHPSLTKKSLKLQRSDATLATAIGNELDKAVKDSRERFLVVMLMAGTNRSRYGSIFRDIQNNYSHGNDKCPKSLVDAKRYINTYKPDLKVVR
eukprot:3435122-Ditylum_brightwellii.AAC.1